MLTRLYRGFVSWTSLYGDAGPGEERERREEVAGLIEEFSWRYFTRSMWLDEGTRRRLEGFVGRAEDLHAELSAAVDERGYARARDAMSRRVTKELGPPKREADSGLQAEISGAPRAGWRARLRMP